MNEVHILAVDDLALSVYPSSAAILFIGVVNRKSQGWGGRMSQYKDVILSV